MRRLEGLGFTGQIALIHGGMPYQERERQVESFRRPIEDGGANYLVATDAAGEEHQPSVLLADGELRHPLEPRAASSSGWDAFTVTVKGMTRVIIVQPDRGQDA